MNILWYYFMAVNIIAFAVYGIDKYKAINNKWRIPEATLILFSVAGGALGSLFGMIFWHHKTQKTKFKILVPLFFVLWIVIIIRITHF
ncbi:MAG: DUF1294 domain-containing protein [Lachnospiraceae bacterium]|nr:DUF1294 domain-containing protein [Lachnospiraceae bacterium]